MIVIQVNIFVLVAKYNEGSKEYRFEKSAPLSYPVPRVGDRVRVPAPDVDKHGLPCNTLTVVDRLQDLESPVPIAGAHFVLVAEFDAPDRK